MAVVSIIYAACVDDRSAGGDGEMICDDNLDNDGDGTTDCADADCLADPVCESDRETRCSDGLDNDGDLFTDCVDVDCDTYTHCGDGGLSCRALHSCYSCCTRGDQACQQACDEAASPAALEQMYAVLWCAEEHCASDCRPFMDCYPCVAQHCRPAVENCGAHGYGDGPCSQLRDCVIDCPDLPNGTGNGATCPTDGHVTCLNVCYDETSQAAAELWWVWSLCVLDHCYESCYVDFDPDPCFSCQIYFCFSLEEQCTTDNRRQ